MRGSVPYIEGCKQRSKVMNPNIRMHKDLVVESHQEIQQNKKQHSLTLNQLGSEINSGELAAHCVRELNNFLRGESATEKYSIELLRRANGQGEQGELQIEDNFESNEVWDNLKKVLPNRIEQRLAYLLFHCGLKPREIMHFCPQEFRDVHDIYRLRNNIMNRLHRNADHLHWRLS